MQSVNVNLKSVSLFLAKIYPSPISWITAVSLRLEVEQDSSGRVAWVLPRYVRLLRLTASRVLRYWFWFKFTFPKLMLDFFKKAFKS